MESTQAQAAEGKATVAVLACVLTKLIEANTASGHDHLDPACITKFHALMPPEISVADYLERIRRYASCSNECFVLSLVYIDRLILHNNFALTSYNVHRVVITSVLLAAKFFDDCYYNNAYYSRIGGIPVRELNTLEAEFLFGINFGLNVTPPEFYKYRSQLANHAASGLCKCAEVAATLLGGGFPSGRPPVFDPVTGLPLQQPPPPPQLVASQALPRQPVLCAPDQQVCAATHVVGGQACCLAYKHCTCASCSQRAALDGSVVDPWQRGFK
ncbi:cyclin-domain-containing protein [Tribonema minus]|uniref:Cyclin-domain-containing protein n=1 Tax=Tribonema minus TaxID=303371 RepID=A0A835YHA8_9STRA|nr:cyclin-domain-containing protein [Tribonema minus]